MANLTGKKYGGRQKGTPNKDTEEFKRLLKEHGVEPVSKLCKLLPHLEPEDQATVCLKLLEYIYPKRKAVDITTDGEPLETESKQLTFEQMKDLISVARGKK